MLTPSFTLSPLKKSSIDAVLLHPGQVFVWLGSSISSSG